MSSVRPRCGPVVPAPLTGVVIEALQFGNHLLLVAPGRDSLHSAVIAQAAAAAAHGPSQPPPAAEGTAQQDPTQTHHNGGIAVASYVATDPGAPSGGPAEPATREHRERGGRRLRAPQPQQPKQHEQLKQRVVPPLDLEATAVARQHLGWQLSWQLARHDESGCGPGVTSSESDHCS